MTLALVSALLKVPVRQDLALTGEVSLRGKAMIIGGLKEKAMGAYRAGVRTMIIPKDNVKDLRDVPKRVRDRLTVIPVEHMDEVLKVALKLDDAEAFFREAAARVEPPAADASTTPAAHAA